MKTPRVPFTEQMLSHVVVVNDEDRMKSNSLPFKFIPTGVTPVPTGLFPLNIQTGPSILLPFLSSQPYPHCIQESTDSGIQESTGLGMQESRDSGICIQGLSEESRVCSIQ